MKIKVKVIALVVTMLFIGTLFTGCNQAQVVSSNISTAADNFQVMRRFVAINLRTDTVLFEAVGVFSLEDETASKGRVVLTFKTGENTYKKHFCKVGSDEIFWNVEDLNDEDVSSYRYEINFLPEMLIPFEVVQKY